MSFFSRKPDTRVRLPAMLELRKAPLREPLTPEAARELAKAQQRCLACNAKALCDEALARQDARSAALFCPNAAYVSGLRNATLSFTN